MPRPLSPVTASKITQPITTPGYLVYIGFSVALRYTTRDVAVSWNGFSWVPGPFLERGVEIVLDNDGLPTGTLSFSNSDGAMGAIVLNESIINKDCTIWMVYDEQNIAIDDPVMVFDGKLDEALRITPLSVEISLYSEGADDLLAPDLIIAPPLSNHPLATKIINWGEQKTTLKKRR